MKTPELLMAPDWPHDQDVEEDLTQIPSVRLFWPVPSLPVEMGWLPTAVQLPDDSSGQFFLEVDATFYGDGVSLYGVEPGDDGEYPQLHYLIEEADTAVRGAADPPARLTLYRAASPPGYPSGRRCRAFLGLREAADHNSSAVKDDDLPF